MGAASLLVHLQAADRLEPALDDAELDDMAAVLGHRPSSIADGMVAIDEAVARADPSLDPVLLRWFHRSAVRRSALWPSITAYTSPLPPLT